MTYCGSRLVSVWSTSVMDIMLKFNCIYYCYFCSFFGGFFILLHLLRCIGKKMQKSAFISVTVNTVVIPCRFQCEKDCFILITIIKQWCLIKVGSTLGGLCLFLSSHRLSCFEWFACRFCVEHNSIYCMFAKKSSGRRKDASHICFPLTVIFLLTLHMFTVMFCYPNIFHYYSLL